MKKIILTGGGTAGHVTPNIALVPDLKEAGFDIKYIGSSKGMERDLVADANLDYFGISSGKLRRYFSFKNFTDPFRVLRGYFQAKRILKRYRPDIVFSKGGFVTVPVVFAASKYNIPVIIHESDMTPGLANRLAMKRATKVCHTFPETAKHLGSKAVFTGSPIRKELFSGSATRAKKMCGFNDDKPIIMVTGGSLGAEKVNLLVREALPELLPKFNVVHLCGNGKADASLKNTPGYVQFEYVSEEMKDLFAAASIVISRAGANSIFEIAALAIPNILIPLSANASRGDQILNAESFKKQGFSKVINEDEASAKDLVAEVNDLFANKETYIKKMKSSSVASGVDNIIKLINELTK